MIAGKSFDGTANISIGATDVGALPTSGGTLTNALSINTGGRGLALIAPDDSETLYIQGISGVSPTIPRWYLGNALSDNSRVDLNNYKTGVSFQLGDDAYITKSLRVNGSVTPSDYANFDARYSKFGVSQAWTDVLSGRVSGTWYTNNTGKPIMISVTTDYGPNSALNCQTGSAGTIAYPRGGGSEYIQHNATFIVVPGDTYRVTAAGTIGIWKELR
ncbi:hypothetical protein [Yersinia sp. Marseille-Q5920]|uniref:hypothetical protein n=1 Tax=Yersinia sp. Marseille-Q5920 TaxID=2972785 RepID=UPI002B26DBF4|nr:hypothetical protein [Yersinia sp. Marseille-Q5920]